MSSPHDPKPNEYADLEIRKRPLVIFLILTLAVTALTAVAMWALLSSYFARDARTQAEAAANIYAGERILPTNAVLQSSGEALAALRLQRETEDALLHHYAWVAKDAGVVRIPIDRAMERLVEKGLPVRDSTPAETNP